MPRVVLLRGKAHVIGPYLGRLNAQRLLADLRQFARTLLPTHPPAPRVAARCSFCGQEQNRGRRLIGGPNQLFICAACIRRCQTILDEPPPPHPPA